MYYTRKAILHADVRVRPTRACWLGVKEEALPVNDETGSEADLSLVVNDVHFDNSSSRVGVGGPSDTASGLKTNTSQFTCVIHVVNICATKSTNPVVMRRWNMMRVVVVINTCQVFKWLVQKEFKKSLKRVQTKTKDTTLESFNWPHFKLLSTWSESRNTRWRRFNGMDDVTSNASGSMWIVSFDRWMVALKEGDATLQIHYGIFEFLN